MTNDNNIKRFEHYRQTANTVLELTKGFTPEQRNNSIEHLELLAGIVLELTQILDRAAPDGGTAEEILRQHLHGFSDEQFKKEVQHFPLCEVPFAMHHHAAHQVKLAVESFKKQVIELIYDSRPVEPKGAFEEGAKRACNNIMHLIDHLPSPPTENK